MTVAQKLADKLFEQLVGQPLQDWIDDQRQAGQSWYAVADAFYEVTGVRISHMTLVAWSDAGSEAA